MRNFPVKYDNGEEVLVKVAKRSQLADLVELQKALLAEFIFKGGMTGDLLEPGNTKVWGYITKISALLTLEGGGVLDPDRIDDLDELTAIFFTQSTGCDEEVGSILPDKEGDPYLPSKIAKLHGWSFFRADRSGVWQAASNMAQEMFDRLKAEIQSRRSQEEEEATQTETPPEPESPVVTPMPTPLPTSQNSVQEAA